MSYTFSCLGFSSITYKPAHAHTKTHTLYHATCSGYQRWGYPVTFWKMLITFYIYVRALLATAKHIHVVHYLNSDRIWFSATLSLTLQVPSIENPNLFIDCYTWQHAQSVGILSELHKKETESFPFIWSSTFFIYIIYSQILQRFLLGTVWIIYGTSNVKITTIGTYIFTLYGLTLLQISNISIL